MKFYLSGPMSGLPQYNYPAFLDAAKTLREHGYFIYNPAELDSDEMQKVALQCPTGKEYQEICGKMGIKFETWGEVLARDVQIIIDKAEGMVFLPGWTQSKGARLEAFASLVKPDFQYWFYTNDENGFRLMGLSRQQVMDAIFANV